MATVKQSTAPKIESSSSPEQPTNHLLAIETSLADVGLMLGSVRTLLPHLESCISEEKGYTTLLAIETCADKADDHYQACVEALENVALLAEEGGGAAVLAFRAPAAVAPAAVAGVGRYERYQADLARIQLPTPSAKRIEMAYEAGLDIDALAALVDESGDMQANAALLTRIRQLAGIVILALGEQEKSEAELHFELTGKVLGGQARG